MPITGYSTIGPMEQVWALGWLINRLLTQRPSGLAVVGTWVLAAPAALGLLGISFTVAVARGTDVFGGVLLAGIPGFLCSACYVLLAGRVTFSYFRHGRAGAGAAANDDA